ncbi:MAG: hypothetical protein J1F39_05485 [Clostridiales bacterium]|nr:hypothetical protein [Clostridiales bacterium]
MNKKVSAKEFFLRPPLWLDVTVWALTAIAIGASAAFLCLDIRGNGLAISIYVVAVLLLLLSLYLVLSLCGIPNKIRNNKHVRRYFNDFAFRSHVTSICSAVINLLYAVFGTTVAVLNDSLWLGALVWYRIPLVAARITAAVLSGRVSQKPNSEQYKNKIYLYTGVMMIILAMATVPIVLLVIWQQDSYDFFGIAVIYTTALAVYSVIKMAASFGNVRRARKAGDLAVAAMRNIGVCDALISMFALQATMFAAFGGGGVSDIMNPLVGGLVATLIFGLGVYMTVRAAALLNRKPACSLANVMTESGEENAEDLRERQKDGRE